jgi:hypothetical protein
MLLQELKHPLDFLLSVCLSSQFGGIRADPSTNIKPPRMTDRAAGHGKLLVHRDERDLETEQGGAFSKLLILRRGGGLRCSCFLRYF